MVRRMRIGEEPLVLLKIPGSALIDAKELFVAAGIDGTSIPPDIFVQLGIAGGRFVVPSTERDSFTRKLLPSDGLAVDFDFSLVWSQRRGVFFPASGGLALALQSHKTPGPS